MTTLPQANFTFSENNRARGLSLLSGGLDSMLAVCVLRTAGAEVEGVVFTSPFFDDHAARRAAEELGAPLHVVDFTDDIFELLANPPHGFGGAMNPCIDCHMRMIQRAGELMERLGYDFVATGEVLGQRPMSQNRQSLGVVARGSGWEDALVRPLSAQLMEPSRPEREGLIDRGKLLGLSGRSRKPQLVLAKEFGLTRFPSPAGGCLLTEKGFGHRLACVQEKWGLDRRRVKLLRTGRCFRLPGGGLCFCGRDARENEALRDAVDYAEGDVLLRSANVPGPTIVVPYGADAGDIEAAGALCAAYSDSKNLRQEIQVKQISAQGETMRTHPSQPRDPFHAWLVQ